MKNRNDKEKKAYDEHEISAPEELGSKGTASGETLVNTDFFTRSLFAIKTHPFIAAALMCLCAYVLFVGNTQTALSFHTFILALVGLVLSISIAGIFAVKKGKIKPLPGACITVGTCVIGAVIFYLLAQNIENSILLVFAGGVFLFLAWLYYLLKKTKITTTNLVFTLFIVGVFMRVLYILYTNIDVRQHDSYGLLSNDGHLGYILSILENNALPQGDVRETWQFYHPPGHHLLAALWMKIQMMFGVSILNAAEGLQFLTVFYSCCCMIISYKIFRFFNLKGTALLVAFAVVAFHPTFFMGGSINNDMLSVTFTLGAVLNTLYWYREQRWKHIIAIALCIGFGMMTKLSVWMAAPAVAIVFLVVLIKNRKQIGLYIKQFLVFGVICVPLGLWWSVRNYITHKVPFTYIPLLTETNIQYIGYYTPFERLFTFSPFQFESVYQQFEMYGGKYYEFNPTISLLKTAMFDEGRYEINPIFSQGLFWFGAAVAVAAFAAMMYTLIKRQKNSIDAVLKVFLTILYATYFISYYIFCFAYPHTCTQNIRYAVPLIIIGALYLGVVYSKMEEKNSKRSKWVKNIILLPVALFSLASLMMYLVIIL